MPTYGLPDPASEDQSGTISMAQLLQAFTQLQQQNQRLQDQVSRLQALPTTQPPTPKPKICLPEKFDGSHQKFRGFINQIRLVFQLQPENYPNGTTQVGLI
ncbi:hypothetical protein HK104_004705, partial [Borealophlyctis nickersoniae]